MQVVPDIRQLGDGDWIIETEKKAYRWTHLCVGLEAN